MKHAAGRITRRAAALGMLAACTAPARAAPADACSPKLRVVATTSDLASLAAIVGAGLVQVRTLVLPPMDPESFEPGVRDLALIEDAALVLRVGLGFDFWLDKMLGSQGRSPARWRGAIVDVSSGIPLLEVQGRNPFARDAHAHGIANPHYWLDPRNAATMSGTIAAALAARCPEAGETVRANHARFLAQLDGRISAWSWRLAPWRGAAVLAFHNTWPYFARRFHLNVAGFVEPKEGVTPSAAHVASLLALGRRWNVRAILQTTDEPKKLSQSLAARLGIPLVELAAGVGSVPGTGDYLAFMDHNVNALARALAPAA
ncbi:metal ABC transporter substrate-binding protein [Ramlibacter sp. AN1133]|uniref:metal ABC transporter substrate-binding protein n=1 Tax=Ramlibacter sp. AN1133 TaxID=3133429 RepID=UPI0030BA3D94